MRVSKNDTLSFIHEVGGKVSLRMWFWKTAAGPFKELYSHEKDVTAFGGFGAYELGWDTVGKNVEFPAGRFHGDKLQIELLASGISADLAYTVWIERGEVRLSDREEYTPIAIHVTHIFRRQLDGWKLLHRHGGAVVEKIQVAGILQK
jgi:ketosteroid isomerase-like protein